MMSHACPCGRTATVHEDDEHGATLCAICAEAEYGDPDRRNDEMDDLERIGDDPMHW